MKIHGTVRAVDITMDDLEALGRVLQLAAQHTDSLERFVKKNETHEKVEQLRAALRISDRDVLRWIQLLALLREAV